MFGISKKLLICSFLFCALCLVSCACFAQVCKEPNVAGAFYPDNKEQLSKLIGIFLNNANPEKIDAEVLAIICPHAGYGFSGQTAAFGYKLIKDKPYKTVVILGTSHQYGFSGVSIYKEGKFRTPLGDVEVDNEFTKKLLDKEEEVSYLPQAFDKEHSVEVQIPFLQKTLSDFKIVPVVIGDCSFSTIQRFAGLLKGAIGERNDCLIVVSSDMYHGYDFEQAQVVDNLTLTFLVNMDAQGLYDGLRENKLQLCGGFGAVAALLLSKDLGFDNLTVLKYTNSAIVTDKRVKGNWTVGYTSCVISKPKEAIIQKKGEQAMLNKEQRKKLLEIARESIETYLKTNKKLELTQTDPILLKDFGAFVTLHEKGELRGCIGNLVGTQPLYLTIRDMAVESATGDPRFPSVELPELKDIEIEISVLSPMEKIDSAEKIQLGVHGVLVKKGFRSGVFLPQVATETGWSKEEFLSNLCSQKAGLSPDAWKDKSCEIYIFTAEVFSEKEK
ncbi:MAG: AmmeMemoRadiSam system protein B [Candidatus Omnitrophica bacterium]|nr:AmmeMemoRadiSam system protein B [Candidatus Omnitrophota bacterium]